MRTILLALSLLLLPLAACETPASSGGRDLARGVEGRTWRAEAINGQDVIDGTTITLKIEGDRVSGKAGCNGYGGPVEIRGDRVKFGSLFSTKMACTAGGVMDQEQRYLNALQGVTRGEVRDGGALVLHGAPGDIEFKSE